jgi:hypothetical protein
MFFGMFLLGAAIVWLLGLAFVIPARLRVGSYSALSLLFAVVGLILFTFFSWWSGILPLRLFDHGLISYSISYPMWYLERGTLGIAILVLGFLALVSPVFAAWLSWFRNRQSPKPSAAQ